MVSEGGAIECCICGTINPTSRLFCAYCHLNLRKPPSGRPRRVQSARRSRVFVSPLQSIPPQVQAALRALGLESAATIDLVQAAYRRLMKQFHPDRLASANPALRAASEARTKQLNSAYRLLQAYYRR